MSSAASESVPPGARSEDALPPGGNAEDLTILILAPTRNDAALTAEALAATEIQVAVFPDLASLCRRAGEGCGGLFIAEEALHPNQLPLLSEFFEQQPSWSDIPIAIITSAGEMSSDRRQRLMSWASRGNVTLIERPFRLGTLLSTAEVALRSAGGNISSGTCSGKTSSAMRNSNSSSKPVISALGSWTCTTTLSPAPPFVKSTMASGLMTRLPTSTCLRLSIPKTAPS